jgi:hypothetical protein
MKPKDILLLSSLGIAGFFVARFLIRKFNSDDENYGLLSKKEIEELYSSIKL